MEVRQLDDFQSKFLEKTTANNERSNFAYMQLSYDIGISYIQNLERNFMHAVQRISCVRAFFGAK